MDLARKNIPFVLLTIATVIGLIWPLLIQDGMFADGMLYTCVAHNLSQGVGTFWFPQFSNHNIAGLTSFHEQPPLVFGIVAIFFKIFGNSMYVERIYTALTCIIAALLIRKIWLNMTGDNAALRKLAWLPILLWITVESSFWSYRNNMQENTMTIFCVLAVMVIQSWFEVPKFWKLLLGAACISLAALSKGVPGLFPLVVPVLYCLFFPNTSFKKGMVASVIITLVVAAVFGVLLLFEDSRKSLSLYFFQRLVQRVNDVPTVDNRLFIIVQLMKEQMGQLILVTTVLLFRKNRELAKPSLRPALFFISIGIAGSFPLALTLVQRTFYYVPSLPFYALGFALLIAPAVSRWIEKITPSWHYGLLVFSSLALVGALGTTASNFGKIGRDEEMLHDVYEMKDIFQGRTTLSVPHELWNRWELQCYLMRYLSVSVEDSQDQEYFLTDKDVGKVPPSYKPVNADLTRYRLYRRE